MGEVVVELKLSNIANLDASRVVRAVADTGAMLSSMPETLANELGLTPVRFATARLVDGRTQRTGIVEGVRFDIEGRMTSDEALVLGDQVGSIR